MQSDGDLTGIIGSEPKRFQLHKRKHFTGKTNKGKLDGGFQTFYQGKRVVDQIGEHRKRIIAPPPSREWEYKPISKVFPNRKPKKEKLMGLRKIIPPESKEYKMSRKRRIEVKNAGIFEGVKTKIAGKRRLEGPKSYSQDVEDEIQKKKRIKVPGEGESKVNLYAAQDSKNYIFRVYQDEVVSPFDSRVTRLDRKILEQRRKKMKGKDNARERKDEEVAVSSLSWNNIKEEKENE